MPRSKYIYLVWKNEPSADNGVELFGAFTVKHEMETAVRNAGLRNTEYVVESYLDGKIQIGPLAGRLADGRLP